MPAMYGTQEHWLARAKEARAAADIFSDDDSRRVLLAIAVNYERIAQRIESRVVDAPS
jgi:hypothetical protein